MKRLTLLTLRPKPGRAEELIAYYRSAGILEASGALSAQVLTSEDDPDEVVVAALWADPAAYAQWHSSPARLAFGEALAPLISPDGASTREFRVVHGFTSAT